MNKSKLIFLLAAANFTHIIDFMLIMPFGETLMEEFQITPYEFTFLVSSYTLSAGIAGFLAAFVLDKIDRKLALMIVYIGFIAGTISCSFSTEFSTDPTINFYVLLTSRCLTGAFGGLIGSVVYAIVGDQIPLEKRGWAMGIISGAFSLASIVGVPLSLVIDHFYQWQTPFFAVGILSIILLIIIKIYVAPMKDHLGMGYKAQSPTDILKHTFQKKNQLFALLFGFLLLMGAFTVIPFISPYLLANLGFEEKIDLAPVYIIGGLCTIVTSPLIGRLADTFGKEKVFIIVTLLSLIPIYLFTNLTPSPRIYILFITALYFILIGGRWVVANAIMTSVVRKENRGSFMSISNSIQQFSAAFAAFITGLLLVKNEVGEYQHFEYAGYIGIGVSIIAVFVTRKLKLLH